VKEVDTAVTQKGQVTIPAEVRKKLGLKPGDKVRFEMKGDLVTIKPAPSKVLKWYGAITPMKRPEDFKKAREDFEETVAQDAGNEG
jgi:antitoxin PrlF